MEEEEEALRNYCRAMISRVRNKQQIFPEPRRRKHGAARGSNWSETERRVASEHSGSNLPVLERNRDPNSPNVGQGPAVPPVPVQLITMLRIKTLKEEMRRAAEVELHRPAVCSVCAQEQASLALKTFIRRKKTQLQLQILKGRLNKHLLGIGHFQGELAQKNLPKPSNAPLWIWEELLGKDMQVTATWGCLSNH